MTTFNTSREIAASVEDVFAGFRDIISLVNEASPKGK